MITKREFAPACTALDEHMDSLLEVLAELLEESPDPTALANNQAAEGATAELLSGVNRAIHVVVNNQEK